MSYAVPPGLQYLTQLDQVLVKQQIEIFELLSGCEMNNKYVLKNSMGQEFLRAIENTDCLERQCCGPLRSFEMSLQDTQEQEIIRLHRPLRCGTWCCPKSCMMTIEVHCPAGNLIGTVNQEWTMCTPLAASFTVNNASGDTVLNIQGPTCAISCGSDVEFQVLTADRSNQIGAITKQWRGFCAEAFTDADNFGITFPMDLEVKMKALLIGAMFLIDFMYFEQKQQR